MMQQTVTSFAELAAGINQIALWHIGGPSNVPFANFTAQLANYVSFASQATYGPDRLPFKPALSWVLYPNPEPFIATFTTIVDARGLNTAAFKNVDCSPEFRPINSPYVPTNSYFSHAVLSGREIYTSLLTSTGATVAAQTTGILNYIKKILDVEHQDMDSIIEINIYLANAADKAAMDAAYVSFFSSPSGGMPLRTVVFDVAFIVPGQVGALVGMKATALKQYRSCDNSIVLYNTPDIYHESSTLSSVGAYIPDLNYVYFAGVYGTRFPGNSLEDPDPAKSYYNALQNILQVVGRKGANIGDFIYLETAYHNPLVSYNGLVSAIARFYIPSSNVPPAVTFDAGCGNPDGREFQLAGLFYIEDDNYELIPSAYPWEVNGALLRQAFIDRFGIDLGPDLPNNYFCTNSTLPGCAKPGYVFDNYPLQPHNSLGSQQLKDSSRRSASKRTWAPEEAYLRDWLLTKYPDAVDVS